MQHGQRASGRLQKQKMTMLEETLVPQLKCGCLGGLPRWIKYVALSTRSSQDNLWLTHSPWLSLVGALVSLSSLHMLPYTYPLRLERHQVRPRLYRAFITTKNTGLSISLEFKSEEGKKKRKKKKKKPYNRRDLGLDGGRETTQPPLAPRFGCRSCPNSRHACKPTA